MNPKRAGSFAIAFVQAGSKVTHVMIRTTSQGFAIQEQNKEEKYFNTVQEVLSHYSSILTRPFESTLPEEP